MPILIVKSVDPDAPLGLGRMRKQENPGMGESQPFPDRIAALRQRLAESTGLMPRAEKADPIPDAAKATTDVGSADCEVAGETTEVASESCQPPGGNALSEEATPAPHSTIESGPVAETLTRGRELLARLRALSNDPLLKLSADDPLSKRFDECTAMVHLALRTVQAFGNASGCQRSLCEGLEAILNLIDERALAIAKVVERRHAWRQRETPGMSTASPYAALAQRVSSLLTRLLPSM